MAQGSKQIQAQQLQQVQSLSPQQILVVKLLELPAVELEDRVRAEILENPALEEGREETHPDEYSGEEPEISQEDGGNTEYDSLSDYLTEDDIPDYKLQEHNRSRDDRPEEIPFSEATSFYETLKEQLGELDLDNRQHEIAEYLVGSLDDDGLLRKPLQTISDELAIYNGIEAPVKEVEQILTLLQDFDPAGVGARSLQECLLIQVQRKLSRHPSPTTERLLKIEEQILTHCYDAFARKHWDKLEEQLDTDPDSCRQAIKEICKLNPRPGASLGETIGKNMQQIVPDFLVETYDDGSIGFTLNARGIPELRMSPDFTLMLEEHSKNPENQSKESRDALIFLKQKMDAAQGFIDALKQRQHTLTVTMQAIIDLQRPFFQEGDENLLRPMVLRDVAERAKLDISTVSRVSNSKYVQTNFGIYPLKFFFGDSYINSEGEELSTRQIRKVLQECVDNEDKKNPLTDDELMEMMTAKGFPMARRTVAKYRQQMNIPVARMRVER
ncbi:MAG: RNA polymerase factor sigma-54 [Bacteroides sp.]|nr:RNA polymerase factor sigma-54 [Bacteroides sp.]